MNVLSGDLVHSGPTPGNESFTQKGIQTTGSIGTHDEMVMVDKEGTPWVGCAQPPHFVLIPLSTRIAECSGPDPTRNMVILRWREWDNVDPADEEYVRWQHSVASMIMLLAKMKTPYDTIAISSLGINRLRSWIKLIKSPCWRQIEHHMYCTESCEYICRSAYTRYVNLFRLLPEQKLYAPVHIERVLMMPDSDLVVKANFGMMERLAAQNAALK